MHVLHLVPCYNTNEINYNQSVLENVLNTLQQKLSVQRLDEKYKVNWDENLKNCSKICSMKHQR